MARNGRFRIWLTQDPIGIWLTHLRIRIEVQANTGWYYKKSMNKKVLELPIGRFLTLKSLGFNRVIIVVLPQSRLIEAL